MMVPLPISSSAINAATYDAETEELLITFTDGSTYLYDGVTALDVAEFVGAASQGAWFNQNLRNRGRTRLA